MDRLIIIPTWKPSYKKVSPFKDRLEMCKLAFDGILKKMISMIEETHRFRYTYQTLVLVKNVLPESKLFLFVGSDWDVNRFKNFDQIKDKCKIVYVIRPGHRPSDKSNIYKKFKTFEPPIGIQLNSSSIRGAVKRNRPINGAVSPEVLNYIRMKGLYVKKT